jgi:hypothetical protein
MPNRERRCHWLSRNKASRRPDALLIFDTEATIDRPTPLTEQHSWRLGVGALCEYSPFNGLDVVQYRHLREPVDLWAWANEASRTYENLVLVSHNIDYDSRLSRAFHYLPLAGFEPEFAVISQSCTYFEWKRGDHRLQLLDSLNLFPYPLENLGKSVGLEKLAVDFDTATDDELTIYCHRDVEILVAAFKRWLRFLDEHSLGNFAITIAGQAFNAYRHTWMPCQIGIHDNVEALELERDAYRGGRCEVFYLGDLHDDEYYKIDVNGLYAAMMAWYPYPRRLIKILHNVQPRYLDHLLDEYLCIAEVALHVEQPKFPMRTRNRNCYPTGAFVTTLTTPELQLALIDGDVVGVGRVAIYEPDDLFSEYIDWATRLRADYRTQGDFAQSQMCKLLRNTLHGKFGQHGYSQTILGDAPLDAVGVKRWTNMDTGEECTDLTFGGRTLRQMTGGESYDSFPAIPAHVNGYGRAYMWSLMQMAGRDHVFYIDTDGMIVDRVGYANLAGMIDPAKLGYLKLEGTATDVQIRAVKDYKFAGKNVIKGAKSNAVWDGVAAYSQWHFTTLKYAFHSHKLEGVTLHRVRRELRREVVHGEVLDSGWVKPPRLHLSPTDIDTLLAGTEHTNRWVWEFNQEWLRKLRQADDLNWRIHSAIAQAGENPRFWHSHEPIPAPSSAVAPLHLEPLLRPTF